ncbi:GAF and ANTAR domain-containing protein [Catenulispora sp. NL8]|uniref:GAF and ANTAR domain-containing protein n=1 Tax=Catenulispora pinistramenti TaxID=2705254 RepID=A0ABS5L1B0_9ACTN|nr:GAF and ANTAR domain-containing protein [Catenulispora pinistramenti]MBS2552091.1 GAF and ANTAR domain-containing protein [Catenulispora pinistramenti]
MISDRMAIVLALLDRTSAPNGTGGGLSMTACAAASTALGVDGLCAVVGTGAAGTVLAFGAQAVSAALEDLEFTLGEGPSLEAVASGVPVLTAELAAAQRRWPAFTGPALQLGVNAVFAFPLRIGAIDLGTLTAYRATVGALNPGQVTDALALADAVTLTVLHRQAADGTDRGAGPDAGPDDQPGPGWAAPATYRAEVHQATGMVSVQLGVGLAEALARLRAFAFGRDLLLAEVAADVVARRLRFTEQDR